MNTCFICGHEFQAGDGYAFFRDDTERICHRGHQEWFGSKLHQEHVLRNEEIKPKTAEERMAECKHTVQFVKIDPAGGYWQVCEEAQ